MATAAPTPLFTGGDVAQYTKEATVTDDTNLFSNGNILSVLEYLSRELTNSIIGNPRVIGTPTDSTMMGPLFIKAIQWIDRYADITDNDDLEFTMDGSTVKVKAQTNLSNGSVFYESNFREKTFNVSDRLFVTTIDSGELLIWLK